ncbi:MAG: TraR/DksA family transcriptional regulator [Deltaproteobacteria bacterium]|nr:TraR/DksA family transcriptional regulator [Deltaproteobacteria bacterium]
MTYHELEFLKNNIREKLAKCIRDPKLSQKLSENSDQPVEIVERAQIAIERDLYLTLRNRVDDRITELREALDHADNHDFGICLDCGDNIPVKRLMAQPTTKLCVECQAEKERKERFLRDTAEDYEW